MSNLDNLWSDREAVEHAKANMSDSVRFFRDLVISFAETLDDEYLKELMLWEGSSPASIFDNIFDEVYMQRHPEEYFMPREEEDERTPDA